MSINHRNVVAAAMGLPVLCLLLGLLLCLCIVPAPAYASVLLDDSADSYTLGPSTLEVLEDHGARLEIVDITSPGLARSFKPVDGPAPNFGMSASAYWFRFTVANQSHTHENWLLLLSQPVMDEVDLYIPKDDGQFELQRSGVARPMSIREIQGRSIVLPLPLDRTPRTFYLRARIQGRAMFPLTIMTDKAFQHQEAARLSLTATVCGFMLAMALIGTALLIFVRERSYLYVVLYLLSSLMTMLNITGYYYAWLLPEQPALYLATQPLSAILMTLTGLLFTRSFLKVGNLSPRLDSLLHWLIGLNALLLPGYLLLPPLYAKSAVNLMYLLATVVSGIAAYVCFRKGFAPARYFLFSRLVVYLGSLLFALINFNLLPNEFLFTNAMYLVLVLDATFIAIALADRINTQRRQIGALVDDLRREITERTAAHKAVEQEMCARLRLEQEVVSISDDERFKISRELHDGLCQQLTGARLLCSTLASQCSGVRESHDILQPLNRLLDEAVDQAYSLSRGAWPIEHEPQEQRTSLQEFIQRTAEQSGIDIAFYDRRICRQCRYPQLTHLYRIAQEAVTNAVKHSHADRITVSFDCSREEGIRLEIRDNGAGCSGVASGSPGGMGIRIMSHRARMIGGSLKLGSQPAGGTSVLCNAPCTAADKEEQTDDRPAQ